ARPVFDDYGQIVAVAYAATRFHRLAEVAEQLGLDRRDLLLVLDSGGTIVGRFPDDDFWRGKNFAASSMVQKFLAAGGGEDEFVALDGVRRRFVHDDIQVSGQPVFHIAVGIDESRIYAQARQVFYIGL